MRKVLITGASSGFGKLLTQTFLQNGDMVIATGRNLIERNDIFLREREAYPGKLLELNLDVTKKDEIAEILATMTSRVGELDVLINNAGFGLFGALEDLTEDEIRYQMEVNFFGTALVTKTLLPLIRHSKGKIFNFSSVFGFMGFPLTSLYCASKFAVEGLTESLRGELAPHGVQVCLIEPGGYRTNFGTNLAWSSPSSTYQLQLGNYRRLRDKLAARKPQLPSEVSEGVLALSKRKTLPMRKVFGKDGRVSYIMKRVFPSSLYYKLMDVFFKKIFLKSIS